jgi:hypothetical protein
MIVLIYEETSLTFSRILFKSCFFFIIFIHGFDTFLFIILGTLRIVKSVGTTFDKSSHLIGTETVAESIGLGEKIDAIVFPLAF